MCFEKWANSKVKKMDWKDISLIKLSTAAFVLMAAKLWEPLLSLDWYWYAVLCVLAAIKPMYDVYRK